MSGSGGDTHDGRLASVHTLDPDRPKRSRSLPEAPAAPNQEAPTPDRNAALSMLGTFDLDDVDFRSSDEILATLAAEPTVSEAVDPPRDLPIEERIAARGIPVVEDAHSDDILRQLEEHHHRGHAAARPSAPRGSAQMEPFSQRHARPTRKRGFRSQAGARSEGRGRRRIALFVACAGALTATATAGMLYVLGGTPVRPTTAARPSRFAAASAFTLGPSNFLAAAANAVANEDRQLARGQKSPVRHRRRLAPARKRSTRHHMVTHTTVTPAVSTPPATVAPVISTSPATSSPSYSSSTSAAAASSQPASNTAAAATGTSASHQSQPAFGPGGSLGPGRGAAGTQ